MSKNGTNAGSSSGAGRGRLGFELSPLAASRRDVLVDADVRKLDKALSYDAGFHVGKGGSGPSSVKGRYSEARSFIATARESGGKVHATEVHLGKDGRPHVGDGRHRFAAIRDSGRRSVPVAVPRAQAARFARLFGRTSPGKRAQS